MKLLIKDILTICNGKLIIGNEDLECTSFSKDTRTIQNGDVYVGIKGNTFDGNKLFKEAFDKGTIACLLDNFDKDTDLTNYQDKTIVLVNNTIEALQKLATYKREQASIPVIAVTGSVGKTSTKDMIASVLSQKYKVLKTQGNYNNNIGLPLTILSLQDEEIMVLEMGMNNLGEISLLSKIAKPNIAVITNVGTAHIGLLGSRENILKAKLEILDGMNNTGTLIINNDNDLLHKSFIENKLNTKVITIGIDNTSYYQAHNISDNGLNLTYTLNDNNININVGGIAFVYNSLIAYAVGKCMNIPDNDIIKGLKDFKLSANRLERIDLPNGVTIINDTYNANYEAVKSVLDLLAKTKFNRKIFLFGDMLELEEYTENLHKQVGEYIIKSNIDYVILVGNYVKYTEKALQKNGFNNIFHFNKEEDTYSFLTNFLQKGDIILLKGSHSMNLVNIVNYLKDYTNV